MKLLIVEDEPDVAGALIGGLRILDANYQIQHAGTLDHAKRLVEQTDFDAALVDLTLPDASYCDVAVALRATAPELPLVALTGHDFDTVGVQLVRIGVQDYLRKGDESIEKIHQAIMLACERERQRARLRRRACYDDLTGVMNRRQFETQFLKAISHAERNHHLGAVLLLDVDDFKLINDEYGHQAGDEVLCLIADKVSALLRAGDSVARLGGDEFAALIEGLNDPGDAMSVVRKVHHETCGTISVAEHDVEVTTSVGVSVFPTQGRSSDELLYLADQAMYRAKRAGKARFACAAR